MVADFAVAMARSDGRHTIRIGPGLWEWAQAHVNANPQKGYGSVTDFVKHVLRNYLEEHGPEFHPDYEDKRRRKE